MRVKVTDRYKETFIPPRCRKPRTEVRDVEVTANIREVKTEDAPVAYIVQQFGEFPIMVRLHKGQLYRNQIEWRHDPEEIRDSDSYYIRTQNHHRLVTLAETNWERHLKGYQVKNSAEDAIREIRRKARNYIIVDGEVYERTGEPYFYPATFGLGANHGGTGMFVGFLPCGKFDPKDYPRCLCPAHDRDRAVWCALAVALGRGDTDSVEHLREGGNGNVITLGRGDTDSVEHLREGGNGNVITLIPQAIKSKLIGWDRPFYPSMTEEKRERISAEVDKVEILPYEMSVDGDYFYKSEMDAVCEKIRLATGVTITPKYYHCINKETNSKAV